MELNGTLIKTQQPQLTIDLSNGPNVLKVTTNVPCQGSFEEHYFMDLDAIVFPNPILNVATLLFQDSSETVDIEIFDLNGRLAHKSVQPLRNQQVTLDFIGLPSGVYYVKAWGQQNLKTIKVFKK